MTVDGKSASMAQTNEAGSGPRGKVGIVGTRSAGLEMLDMPAPTQCMHTRSMRLVLRRTPLLARPQAPKRKRTREVCQSWRIESDIRGSVAANARWRLGRLGRKSASTAYTDIPLAPGGQRRYGGLQRFKRFGVRFGG